VHRCAQIDREKPEPITHGRSNAPSPPGWVTCVSGVGGKGDRARTGGDGRLSRAQERVRRIAECNQRLDDARPVDRKEVELNPGLLSEGVLCRTRLGTTRCWSPGYGRTQWSVIVTSMWPGYAEATFIWRGAMEGKENEHKIEEFEESSPTV